MTQVKPSVWERFGQQSAPHIAIYQDGVKVEGGTILNSDMRWDQIEIKHGNLTKSDIKLKLSRHRHLFKIINCLG